MYHSNIQGKKFWTPDCNVCVFHFTTLPPRESFFTCEHKDKIQTRMRGLKKLQSLEYFFAIENYVSLQLRNVFLQIEHTNKRRPDKNAGKPRKKVRSDLCLVEAVFLTSSKSNVIIGAGGGKKRWGMSCVCCSRFFSRCR